MDDFDVGRAPRRLLLSVPEELLLGMGSLGPRALARVVSTLSSLILIFFVLNTADLVRVGVLSWATPALPQGDDRVDVLAAAAAVPSCSPSNCCGGRDVSTRCYSGSGHGRQ